MSTHGSARRTSILALVLLCGGLTACAPSAPTPQETSTPAPTETVVPQVEESAGETPIRIVIGDHTLEAVLWDNPAALSLVEQLPFTLEFADYGGREAIAEPPQPLTMDGMPESDSPLAGDLSYYAPSGVISLTYADLGEWNGAARLGRIDGDLLIVQDRAEPFTVTLERAD